MPYIFEKLLIKAIILLYTSPQSEITLKTLWASKVARILISEFLGFPTWESWDKITFRCRPHGQAQRIP
jgi:hypothetical protein